jgi:hypothetical protein
VVGAEGGTRRRAAILGVALAGALVACENDRGGDVPNVRAALEKLPGVRVIDAEGWDSMWPIFGPIDIRADLQVRGSGRLILCNLTPESVRRGGGVILARVGEWVPNVMAQAEMGHMRYVAGCPNSVDLDPGSPFLKLVQLPLHSVADVVANYEALSSLIDSWPTEPKRIEAADGSGWISYYKSHFERLQ